MKKFVSIIVLSFLFSFKCDAQILISLLFGDKLNSDKIEFGIAAGASYSNTTVPEVSRGIGGLSLGFYFEFKLDDKWSIAPSCQVLSTMGATGITPYPLNLDFDNAMVGGQVKRKLNYFQVPVLMRYQLSPRFYTSVGPQFSLLRKATDVFMNDIVDRQDLTYENNIIDQYKKLDVGGALNFGYRLRNEKKSMSLGLLYYQGMINILKNNNGSKVRNNSLLVYLTIPIGAGKKAKPSESGE